MLGCFYSDRRNDIFSTFLAGVTVRSPDSRVANKRAYTKRKVAGLTSDCRRRKAVAGGGEQMEVEWSNRRWRGAISG